MYVITCIPKGNKDKTLLKNWRPISLLNVSYKIASSAIASRIKQNLGKLFMKIKQALFRAGLWRQI